MVGWRSFLVRRLLGRFHVGEDILRHLSTFQRLGESLEATPPGEMLPVGMRTVLRAVRTRGAVQIRPGWVWPFWLEQQIDPTSPAFLPRGHLPFMTNVTRRNWTMVGALDSEWEGIVDPRGLFTAWFDGWSLDWWVGTPDGWRFPSRDDSVTQDLMEATPVVRTVMPVGAGSVEHLVYCPLNEDTAVIAIRNETAEALDIALAVRPYNPEGLAVLESLLVSESTVLVDGRPALFLPEAPERTAVSTFREGDSAAAVVEGFNQPAPRDLIRDRAGMIQAAFVYQVAPGEELRCAVPLPHERREERRKRLPKRLNAEIPIKPAGDVVSQWKRVLSEGMQVSVPDSRLQEAIDANRAYMKLFHDGDGITPGPYTYHRFWFRDAAYQLVAMARWGFHREAASVISSFGRRQHRDGFFYSQWREWDSNGAALWTIAEYYRLTGDRDIIEQLRPFIKKGARWIVDMCNNHKGDPGVRGLFPPGVSAEHLGPFDYYYWDDFWGWKGLLEAEYLLRELGEQDDAVSAAAGAERLKSSISSSLDLAAKRLGQTAIPAGPTRGFDAAMVGSLAACYPLGLLAASDPWITGTAEVIRERFCIDDAFFQQISHTGLGTYLTLQLAFVELESKDPRAWQRLRWMLDAATPTFTWPEAIHPRLGGGCMGDGHHGWAAADFLSFVRNVLVRESGHEELAVLTLLPEEWRGRDIKVKDAPTQFGSLSFELKWRGGKAVLEWEKSSESVALTIPSLDPSWRTRDLQGSATFDGASVGT
jgi:hypothetical protein